MVDCYIEQLAVELPEPILRRATIGVLQKVFSNITSNPDEPKYRTLKKENKMVSEKIGRSAAAVSILFSVGFVDNGAAYVCPNDADIDGLAEAALCLECILESMVDEPPPEAMADVATTPERHTAPKPTAATHKAELNPENFSRRKDVEKDRQQQMEQLQAARQARKDGYGSAADRGAGNGYAATVEPIRESAGNGAKKSAVNKAFDFESRSARQQESSQAASSLADLRKEQREKFKDFESDPNARQAAAYQQPASVAAGGKESQSWGDWAGGFFGGSGGSSDKPKPQQRPDRPGPTIKGIGDLPKPVQRGG